MNFFRRLAVVLGAVGVLLAVMLLLSFDIIKIDWISFMEIQPSFKAMESPLPVANRSVPIEGAAYIAGQGDPTNPIPADEFSINRGQLLYSVNCAQCHGATGEGNGVIAGALVFAPRNLTLDIVQAKADGNLFLTISNGIQGTGNQIHMPAMNENLTVRDRWDVVNYIRTLKPTAQ